MRTVSTALLFTILTAGLARAQTKPILRIEIETGEYAAIKLLGESRATYAIESKSQIEQPFWLTRAAVVASGGATRWVDPLPLDAQRRFYRAVKTTKPAGEPLPNMVWLPQGSFIMGSPANEKDRFAVEGPQTHTIFTKGFWIGKYEVTQREYLAVMGSNPSAFVGDLDRPVESVSWLDAVNYCEKVTALQRSAGKLPAGYEYRLPTEAQWEYACRAGTKTRFSFGDAMECDAHCSTCDLADWFMWWCGNGSSSTRRIGQKQPNLWALHDMHGNVWEWCADWYHDALPGGAAIDPKGPASGSMRVFRGGGYVSQTRFCRSAYRFGAWPDFTSRDLGFRIALVPAP